MAVKTAAALKAQYDGRDPRDHNTDLIDTIGDPAILPAATTTAAGKVELATNAEAIAGTDAVRAVTPANLAAMTALATAASSTAAGVIELATDAEAQAGAMTDRAITPANLAAVTATATRAGVVELATDAEAKTGTDTARAVTAANVRSVLVGLKTISFNGKNGAGAISAVGAVVGDKVIDVFGMTSGALGSVDTLYETTITVNDQIQQSSASDLSTKLYVALLLAVA